MEPLLMYALGLAVVVIGAIWIVSHREPSPPENDTLNQALYWALYVSTNKSWAKIAFLRLYEQGCDMTMVYPEYHQWLAQRR